MFTISLTPARAATRRTAALALSLGLATTLAACMGGGTADGGGAPARPSFVQLQDRYNALPGVNVVAPSGQYQYEGRARMTVTPGAGLGGGPIGPAPSTNVLPRTTPYVITSDMTMIANFNSRRLSGHGSNTVIEGRPDLRVTGAPSLALTDLVSEAGGRLWAAGDLSMNLDVRSGAQTDRLTLNAASYEGHFAGSNAQALGRPSAGAPLSTAPPRGA